MKKILLFLVLLCSITVAKADTVLTGDVQFDWVDISQVQRDAQIDKYKALLFDENSMYSKKEFKQKFVNFKKDNERVKHYIKANAGIKEISDANLCAFFNKQHILLIYAVQYKNNPKNVYYYDGFGHLRYLDDISDNYPNFPYSSKQYKNNGKLISAIYFISPEIQYMYEPSGEFKGLWYKDKMYDRNGKQTLTRTNWGI